MEPGPRLSKRMNMQAKFQIQSRNASVFQRNGALLDINSVSHFNEIEVIYTLRVTAQMNDKEYAWDIHRTYTEFAELQSVIQAIKFKHTHPPRLISWGKIKKLPASEKQAAVFDYLNKLINDPDFNITTPVLEFLEVSMLSFEGSTRKRKEGYVSKRTGGRTANERHFFNCNKYYRRYQKRWIVIRDNLVGYLANNTQENLHEALLFKGKFKVLKGESETGFPDGVKILTAQRQFVFRAGSEFKMMEWVQAINDAYNDSDWKLDCNPFDSSFPVRSSNKVTWYVDGADYFEAVYDALLMTRNTLFISDWWLSPELYLKRPADEFPESQVKSVLRELATKGVKIYITLYKEVEIALTLNSLHTKRVLEAQHPNIKVLRHPQRSLVGGEFLWSHHEKILVIDQEVAFMGGLDLCFGRMDTPEHLLVDDAAKPYWNGIDYSNSRIADFTCVENWQRDSIDRSSVPRMPWHDIALKVVGRTAVDIALHFIELWNHITLDVTGNYHKNKQVLEPTPSMTAKDPVTEPVPSDIPRHKSPFMEAFAQMVVGQSKNIDLNRLKNQVFQGVNEDHALPAKSIETRKRLYSARTSTQEDREVYRIENASLGPHDFKNSLSNSLEKVLKVDVRSSSSTNKQTLIDAKSREETEEETKELSERKRRQEFAEEDVVKDMLIPTLKSRISSSGKCRSQVLRSAGTWSLGLDEPEMSIHTAYLELIDKAKNFIYIENQFFISNTAGEVVKNSIAQAIVDRILAAVSNGQQFKVIVVMPLLPAFEGSIDDEAAAVLRLQLFWEYKTICRGPTSLCAQLAAKGLENPEQYISFYGLRTHAELGNKPVTEIIYVHSKLMIVDDDLVILGSANINDRSMLGRHDSEIALLVQDDDKVTTTVAGQEVSVSQFAYSLRMSIFKEHSGCHDESALRDPFSLEFGQVWQAAAKNNTLLYRHVFRCYPDDLITSLADLSNPEEAPATSDYPLLRDSVRGHLVEFPLNFLSKEDLRISIFSKEFYIPEASFV